METLVVVETPKEEKPAEVAEEIAEEFVETPAVSTVEAVELALNRKEEKEEAQAAIEEVKQEVAWTGDIIGRLESTVMDTNVKLDTLINLLTPKEEDVMAEEETPIVIEEKPAEEKPAKEKKPEEKPVESSEKKKKRFWV